MNRTIKDAAVKRYHHERHNQLADFVAVYNRGRLKTVEGLIRLELIYKIWTAGPDKIVINPIRQIPRLSN